MARRNLPPGRPHRRGGAAIRRQAIESGRIVYKAAMLRNEATRMLPVDPASRQVLLA